MPRGRCPIGSVRLVFDAQNALLFTKGKLTNAAHTLKVVVTGQKNPASTGTALVHDYIIAYVD